MAFKNINGAKLWYDESGQGEPILLHHGYTASRDNWQPVAERLSSRYRVVLMECRGCGESEHTDDGYNLEQYAEDAVTLMTELGHASFNFAGHSMGGGVGMTVAINHPSRLNKLVLMASVGSKGLIGKSFRDNVNARLQARKNNDREFFFKEQTAGRFRPEVQSDAWIEKRIHHLMHVVSDKHLTDSMASMQSMDYTAALTSITTPTLVIGGGVDPLLTTNLEDYQRLPDASLQVFFRAAHEIGIHETAGVAAVIEGFLQYGALNASTLKRRVR